MPRKILIVDDSRINRLLLHRILSDEYETLHAENGEEAMQALRGAYEEISAVLLDLIMPRMDGFEVLSLMQKDENLSNIPVIVTTSSTEDGAEVRALSLGANDFIMKPYNPAVIRHKLWNTIKLRETAAYVNTIQRDRLTGLYNRETFFAKAEEMIAAHEPGYYMMSCIDIESFKVINDQYGNAKGDDVLRHVAATMREGMEPLGGLCSRISGDKFAILYPSSLADTEAIAKNRADAGCVAGLPQPVTFSVGRYHVQELSLSGSAMYDRAAIAGAFVKSRYDIRVAQYTESMREDILREQEIINEMNAALVEGQFEIWLQPQYNHSSGALIGAEALVRWRHPEKGLVSPGAFIPVFERNGFIYEMDKEVWRQACALLRKWIDEGKTPLPLSVNVSRYDLLRDGFLTHILGLVQEYNVPKGLLRLEITESAFSKSTSLIIAMVKRLIEHGFTIEIDDFGSGYSSLNTLKDVPADILKLDMRFLESGENASRSGNILESIIRMAKWLGMPVIAEGVETREQADYLRSIGCLYVQGYLYARPMPVPEYERLMDEAGKERGMISLETVETLDNDAFWNPNSMETLIFNSYVGGACIFEYHNGRVELLRVNAKYALELGGEQMTIEEALAFELDKHMDEHNLQIMFANIQNAIATDAESACEVYLTGIRGHEAGVYVRSTVRVIARAGERMLLYCSIINTTARHHAERKEHAIAEQMRIIMENMNGGVSAVTIDGAGVVQYVFANNQYYAMLGYTCEQFEAEVQNAFDILHPEDRPIIREAVTKLLESGGTQFYEYRCFKRGGELIYLRCNVSITSLPGVDEPVLLSVISDVTEIAAANRMLRETDEQLRFLNEVAHDLLAQEVVGRGMDDALRRVMAYFDGDRAYVFENDHERGVTSNTFEVCAPGVKSEKDGLQDIPMEAIPFWTHAFERNRYISIEDVEAMGEEAATEQQLLRQQGIRSLVAVPLYKDELLLGFLGVDDPRRNFAHVDHLRAIGDYLVATLTRRDLNARIEQDHKTLLGLMNDTPGGFVRMQALPDGRINPIYVNEGFSKLVGMSASEILERYHNDAMWGVHPEDTSIVLAAIQEMGATGVTHGAKYRLRHGNGGYVWLSISGRRTENDAGEAFYNIYYADVSETERTELSFREVLTVALRAMMANSGELSFIKDRNLVYICCTEPFAKMVGLESAEEIVGKTDYDLFDRALAEQYRRDDRRLLEEGRALVDYVEPLPSESGTPRYARTSKYTLQDTSGNVLGLYGTGRDITRGRETYARLQLLTNAIPGGLATYELSPRRMRVLSVNDGFLALTGYTEEEYQALLDENPFGLVYAEDVPEIRKQFEAVLAGKPSFSYVYRSHVKGGGFRWISLHGTVAERSGDTAIANVVKFDVTEQMTANETLRVREEEYRLAIEHSGKMIYRYLHADNSVDLPPNTQALLGLPARLGNMPTPLLDNGAVAPESVTDYLAFYDAIRRGDPTGSTVIRRRVADGSYRWFSTRFSNIIGNDGKPVSAIIMFEDVTDERERDSESRATRESERVWQLVATHSNRMIYRYDFMTGGRCDDLKFPIGVNLVRMDESASETLIDRGLVLPESAEDYRQMCEEMHAGLPSGEAKLHILDTDGSLRWAELKFSLIYAEDGAPKSAVISFMDITESHEKELAYSRYLQTIHDNAASEGVLVYLEADVTSDVTEKQGGSILPEVFPAMGRNRAEIIEHITNAYIVPEERARCREFFSREHLITVFSDGGRTLSADWEVVFPGGASGFVRSELQMVQDPYSGHIKVYTILRDITDEKRAALAVKRQAETDGMTDLYNKTTTEALIARRLEKTDGTPCALMIVDLDNFKAINDTYGHDCGDEAIRRFATMLRAQFRRTDIVGRVGGDEFAVFLEGVQNEARLRGVMTAFMQKLAAVRLGEEQGVVLRGSVGVALGALGRESYESLFRKADRALYHVKRNGKDDFAFYTPEMEQEAYRFFGHGKPLVWKMNFYDQEDIIHLLTAVSTVYPMVISVNLTQNSYYMMQYDDYTTTKALSAGVFDELIEVGEKTFHPEDRRSFMAAFSRENLLAAYARGERMISHVGRQLGDDGVYRRVKTDVIFVRNRASEDVLEITLARPLDAEPAEGEGTE